MDRDTSRARLRHALHEKDRRGTSCPVCNAPPGTRPMYLTGKTHRVALTQGDSSTLHAGAIRNR